MSTVNSKSVLFVNKMDSDQYDAPPMANDVLEALFRHDLLDKDSNVSDPSSLVTVNYLWQLFETVEQKLESTKTVQSKELSEVQQYVDHVRTLSEERDKLTAEFECENEKLKREIQELHKKYESEKQEVVDMCQQEGLDELIGSTFSEQMAYLLVVRATLMDKVEVMQDQLQESTHHSSKLSDQLNSLVSEDSELRHRMTSAMSEMGGMASKLTEALKERDQLNQQVVDLTNALNGIKGLPCVAEAKAETATHVQDIDRLQRRHELETERLRGEILSAQEQEQSGRLELTTHIEELQEMNRNLKEVNLKLNDQLSSHLTAEVQDQETTDHDHDRTEVVSHSKRIIDEMQAALVDDEAKAVEREARHRDELQNLQNRIQQLENKQVTPDAKSLAESEAKLAEARRQYEVQCAEVDRLRARLVDSERDSALRVAAGSGWKERHDAQLRIAADLQDRNTVLENELTKVWRQLKEALDKLNAAEREKGMLELRIKDREDGLEAAGLKRSMSDDREEVRRLRTKLAEFEEKLLSETSGTTGKLDVRLAQLETELKFSQDQLTGETRARLELEQRLESADRDLHCHKGSEDDLRAAVSELQKRALNAEAQVLLITGQRDQHQTEKLVAELSRNQLEDAVDLLRERMDAHAAQSRSYADRYKNLKSKHRSKIRRIRELFFLERRATAEETEDLERRLASAESQLARELEWKEEAASDVRRSEEERRNAINAADDALRRVEEGLDKINHLTSAKEDLGAENSMLQKQLGLLEKQKHELGKLVDANRQQQKEELTTLLSSLSMSGSLPQPFLIASGSATDANPRLSTSIDFAASSPEKGAFDAMMSSFGARKSGSDAGGARLSSSYLNLSSSGGFQPGVAKVID